MLTTMFRSSPPDHSYIYASKAGRAHDDEDDDGDEDHGPAEDRDDDEAGQEPIITVSTVEPRPFSTLRGVGSEASETSPLLATRSRESQRGYGAGHEDARATDLEGQKPVSRRTWLGRTAERVRGVEGRASSIVSIVSHPSRWDPRALWDAVVVAPVVCLPAVIVGVLLNILDALSYGECGDGKKTRFNQCIR